MATNRIKGLTVEIGGDTTKLGEALKNVEAKSRSLSSELGSINKLLKLDPTNTDLLAQKQQVLAEAISSTREKLDTLKAAEQQVQEQFARGEVSAEQYRELQRQVTATENKLKKYEESAKDTAETIEQLGKGTKTAEQRTKELADRAGLAEKDLDNLKDKAEETANKGLKVMAAAATAVVAALTASAEATREYRTNMGKLNVAFTDNGHSVGEAAAAYQELVGVIGESDRAVETANHLAKLTDNAEDLSAWYGQILPGVFATFGDSLPLEGLTEAANETAKVAQITGPLADAINWATTSNETWAEALGDNSDALAAFRAATAEGESAEDAFNAALLACSNEQERQSLITKALARLYGSAADAYKVAPLAGAWIEMVNREYLSGRRALCRVFQEISCAGRSTIANTLLQSAQPKSPATWPGFCLFCYACCAFCFLSSSYGSRKRVGAFLYVARLTITSAAAQAMAPGTVGPRPKGVPASFQPTQTVKPAAMPEMMPAFVAFFQ